MHYNDINVGNLKNKTRETFCLESVNNIER